MLGAAQRGDGMPTGHGVDRWGHGYPHLPLKAGPSAEGDIWATCWTPSRGGEA